jgi:hypothetical protein
LKLALAAMAAGDEAIDEVEVPRAPVSLPVERSSSEKPAHVEQHAEFKVLVFRNVKSVQVVVQPRHPDRFAAAAVFRADEPGRPLASRPTALGLEFDLGSPEVNARARVVVTLTDGQSHQLDVPLRS